MAKKRSNKDFIAFILAAENDPRLTKDFISKTNATELRSFFETEGFTEISENNCVNILKSKTKRFATGQQREGNPPPPCPPNARY
jgi:hypothetical protein